MSKQQQAKHTPGPWRIFITANQVPIITSDRGDVAVTRANDNNAGGIEEANARLIAAAPELLAALKDALWTIDNIAPIINHLKLESTLADPRPAIRAIIAKAEGR